jgi:hypothetical protein
MIGQAPANRSHKNSGRGGRNSCEFRDKAPGHTHCLACGVTLGLLLMPGTVAAQAAVQEYAQSYHESFKHGKLPPGWSYPSPLSEQCTQFDPAGLRITMPPGAGMQSAGVVSNFGVKGKFEITLRYDVLEDPDLADVGKGGTRLTLAVHLDTPLFDTPQSEVATLNRSVANNGFVAWIRSRHEGTTQQVFTLPTKTGRLRLARSDDQLDYLVSAGADQPFKFLKKYRFGAEHVKHIAIVGTTGGPKAKLDVRISDVSILADALPDAPGALGTPAPVSVPTSSSGGRRWLFAAVVLLALILVLLFALVSRLRKRGRIPSQGAGAE